MTDKEKIRRAFSSVRLPDDFDIDLESRGRKRIAHFRNAAAAACIALALVVSGVTAYAADFGGIQRTVQIWLHGDQTTAVISIDEDNNITHYSVADDEGNEIHGGGVAIENDGSERALTESEVQQDLNYPQKETIDGRIYLFYKDRKIDITDMFDDEGLCYITLDNGDETFYVTVTKDAGLSTSTKRYIQKNELPEEWFKNK